MTQIAAIDGPAPAVASRAIRAPSAGQSAPGELIEWIGSLLTEKTGLTFPPARRPVLERGVASWFSELGLPARRALAARQFPPNAAMERLISRVTVGETYFFRHDDQLQLVRRLFLAPLIDRRRREANLSLRLWSAGCATGEETYSLAMLVFDALPDAERWDLRIVGTDIDRAALEFARAGRYGRWAFRVAGGYHHRWFRAEDHTRSIDERLRQLTAFEPHNLADPVAPPPTALGGAPDLILCRNVLIYMDPETGRDIRMRLYRSLAPGGWLVFGPVEALPPDDRLGYRQVDGFVLYERRVATHAQIHSGPVRSIAATTSAAAGDSARTVAGRPVARRAAAPLRRSPAPRHPARTPLAQASDDLADATRLADGGRLDEAERVCRGALRRHSVSVPAHVLLATIAEARGDLGGASLAWRQVLYLRADDPLAAFRLGLVEWRRGRTDAARRRLRNSLATLEPLADDLVLDGREGLTVAAVRSTIAMLLG
jgi:chemotaxis protein methyltransferase CheR